MAKYLDSAGVTTLWSKIKQYVSSNAVSNVTVTQTITSGTEIGSISVDGSSTKLYAPSDGGGGVEPWTKVWSGTLGQSTTQSVGKAATGYTEFMLKFTDGSRTYCQVVYHEKASNPSTSISRVTNDGTSSYIASMNVSWTGTNLVTGVARQITRTSSSTSQANISGFQITALYAR